MAAGLSRADGSVGRFVRLDDGLGDPAALCDLVAVGPRPLLDGLRLLGVALARGRAATALRRYVRGTGGAAAATADAPGVGDVDPHRITQLLGVLVGQVDLVGGAVETKRDRLALVVRDLCSVDVVDELDDRALCHF